MAIDIFGYKDICFQSVVETPLVNYSINRLTFKNLTG